MPLQPNSDLFYSTLSDYQFGFSKRFNAQHCLVIMIKKWKKMLIIAERLVS